MAIEGKVAGILNIRELTINIGSNDNVSVGMKFKVLASSPLEIKDPVTGELLGTLDREKVRVKVAEMFEKYSICRTFRNTITHGMDLSDYWQAFRTKKVIPETLKAEDSSLPPPLSEEESYVKKGDRVIQIEIDEDE